MTPSSVVSTAVESLQRKKLKRRGRDVFKEGHGKPAWKGNQRGSGEGTRRNIQSWSGHKYASLAMLIPPTQHNPNPTCPRYHTNLFFCNWAANTAPTTDGEEKRTQEKRNKQTNKQNKNNVGCHTVSPRLLERQAWQRMLRVLARRLKPYTLA